MPLFDNIIKPDDADKATQTPITLDALRIGFQSQEAFAEKNMQESKGAIGNFFNLEVYGPDIEVMNQAKKQFQEATQGLSTSDFSNPQTASKINSIITQITQNPKVQGAVSRGTTYQRMNKEKEKAEAAGKEYINLGFNDAQNYYNGSDFIDNKRFSDSGYIAADIPKLFSEIEKTVPEQIEYTTDPTTGARIEHKYKDPEQMRTMMDVGIKSTPHAYQTLKDQFALNSGNVDWKHAATTKVAEDYNTSLDLIDNADTRLTHLINSGASNKEIAAVQAQKEYYTKKRDEYKDLHDNPYTGDAIRQKYQDDYVNDQIEKYTRASIYHKYDEDKMNKAQELAIQHTNKLSEDAYTQSQDNYRKQLEIGSQEGVLKQDDKGNLVLSKPGETGTLPATKSNTLHVGGNPLTGDVKLEEIDNAINSKNPGYIEQLVSNSKLKTGKGGDWNKVEITPDHNIKLIREYHLGTNKGKEERVLSPVEFSSLIVGKDSKSQIMVTQYYDKQRNVAKPFPKNYKELQENQLYKNDKGSYIIKNKGEYQTIPQVHTKEDYDKLPKGKYVDSQGTLATK